MAQPPRETVYTKWHLVQDCPFTYTTKSPSSFPLQKSRLLIDQLNFNQTPKSNQMEPKSLNPQSNKTLIPKPHQDLLTHLEIYLSKRDGVDKLLKISRYATKILLASTLIPTTQQTRLKSFESSVGISRKAFRLGKFVQDVNSLRKIAPLNNSQFLLSIVAYGGEGLYYFVEQLVWLGKSGLIDKRHLGVLQKWSAWFEFVGYFGSVGLKVRELREIDEEERCLVSSVEVAEVRGVGCGEEMGKLRKLREKKVMKRLSVVQDFADGLMALADIRDGKGRLSGPLVVSSAGLLSAVISTHKNWVSC